MPDETDYPAGPGGLFRPQETDETVLPSGEVVARPAAMVPVARETRALITREAIAEEADQRAILAEYVRQQMVPDVDYGVIPGTAKPTLLKPGAEKLTELFRCTAEFELTHKVEDWDRPLFHYAFTCRIRHRGSGTVVAEGVGSCNSMEARYRWRNADRTCPQCGKPTIIKGKAEYGGGWLCFAKKGGCGFKWPDGAKEIEGQSVGKVENDDVFTLTNTVLKMAKKRAHVDAGIALGRVSDIFTQDMEDQPQDQPAARGGKPGQEAALAPPAGFITPAQGDRLMAWLAQNRRQPAAFLKWLYPQNTPEGVYAIPARDWPKVEGIMNRYENKNGGAA